MNDQRVETIGDILIVDDTPNNLRLLSQMLSEQGYGVRAVTSGSRALASVEAAPPDLILLDIKMPGMSGYEVCEHLKANEHTHDIPVIFISSLDATQDKVKAFTAGGVDYVTKPLQLEEVLARVETHLSLRRLQEQLQEANKKLEDANSKMKQELALAGEVQASFLPSKLPEVPGWQLAAKLEPARETSGDFYDVIVLPHGQLGILIADVVDKGVGAALYMALNWTLMRTYAREYPDDPERVLHAVNRRIVADTYGSQFVTVFYGALDPATGTLTYCNAGHNPPILLSAQEESVVQMLSRTGMALGVVEDTNWEQGVVQLAPGDTLVLYTDGVTDAQDQQGAFFGQERLQEVAQANRLRSAHEVQEALMAAVREFVGDATRFDDVALVIVVREGAQRA
jgi:sigma-B regulation protein RsbU (phosphoserine phosphatase)